MNQFYKQKIIIINFTNGSLSSKSTFQVNLKLVVFIDDMLIESTSTGFGAEIEYYDTLCDYAHSSKHDITQLHLPPTYIYIHLLQMENCFQIIYSYE